MNWSSTNFPRHPAARHRRRSLPDSLRAGSRARCIGSAWGFTWSALGAGVIGAVLGTLGGHRARGRLVGSFGRDLPVASARRRRRGWRWIRDCSLSQLLCDAAFRRDRRGRRPGRAPAGRTADRGRSHRCDGGAQADRRHLRQHRLHPDQDIGGQCAGRAYGPARRRLRCRHRSGQRGHGESQGAQGRHHAGRPQRRRRLALRHGRLHRHSWSCQLRGSAHVAGRG